MIQKSDIECFKKKKECLNYLAQVDERTAALNSFSSLIDTATICIKLDLRV